MKKFFAIVLSVLMVCSATVNVLAAEWDIGNGDIHISAGFHGQTVTQNGVTVEDDAPVVIGIGSSTITVESSEGATASFTISDLEIHAEDESAIDVLDGSSVDLTVEGSNYVGSSWYDTENDYYAGFHVGNSDLFIGGDGYFYLYNDGLSGAALGSGMNEDYNGRITIGDSVTLEINDEGSEDGASIGSGEYGDFNGWVHITDNAIVSVDSADRGAGIGSGEDGDFNGVVIIDGASEVYAEGSDDSSGIGAGRNGDFNGLVWTTGNASVEAENDENGSPIGSSDGGDFSGLVAIGGNAYVDLDLDDTNTDTLIGANDDGIFDGRIIIGGEAHVQGEDAYTDTIGGESEEQIGTGSEIIVGNDVVIADSYGDEISDEQFFAETLIREDVTDQMIAVYVQEFLLGGKSCSDNFWSLVVEDLYHATAGETVTVEAVGRAAMPGFVMSAVRDAGVTLVINWSGGEAVVDQQDASLAQSAIYCFDDL